MEGVKKQGEKFGSLQETSIFVDVASPLDPKHDRQTPGLEVAFRNIWLLLTKGLSALQPFQDVL